MANKIQDKSKLFIENWEPESDSEGGLSNVSVGLLYPFIVMAVFFVLGMFAGPFAPLLDAIGVLFVLIYCGGSLVSSFIYPIPWFEEYGWLKLDGKIDEALGPDEALQDEKFVNSLINMNLIDMKTRTDEVDIERLKGDDKSLIYRLRLAQAGKNFDNVAKMVAGTAPAMNAFSVQVTRVGNTTFDIMYSFIDPLKAYNKAYKQPHEYSMGDPYRVAVHEPDGTLITLDANKALRAVVTGSSGSGKSVCLQALLNDIARSGSHHQVIIFDPKRVSFVDYQDRFYVINDPDEFQAGIDAVYDEMMRRYEVMKDAGIQEPVIDDDFPLLYIMIDEIAEFFDTAADKKEQDERKKKVKQIISLGRQCGIGLILAGQTIDAQTVDSTIRNNLDYRLVLRTFNQQQAKFVVPEGMEESCPAHQLPTELSGIGYFMTPSTNNMFLMGRVYWITQEEIQECVRECAADKRALPWLGKALEAAKKDEKSGGAESDGKGSSAGKSKAETTKEGRERKPRQRSERASHPRSKKIDDKDPALRYSSSS